MDNETYGQKNNQNYYLHLDGDTIKTLCLYRFIFTRYGASFFSFSEELFESVGALFQCVVVMVLR